MKNKKKTNLSATTNQACPKDTKISNRSKQQKSYLTIIGFISGLFLLLVVVYLTLNNSSLASLSFDYLVLRTVLALAASGYTAIMPGFLNLEFDGKLRAGGSLAVFCIVFFFNPPVL